MIRASIWAQDTRGVIGNGQSMLWRVPGDMRFFKEQTTGCPVIMGRASFEAIGRPLPDRTNIVLTRNHHYKADGVTTAASLEEAFEIGDKIAEESGAPMVWVIGGGDVYQQAMDYVDQLFVTDLDLTVPPSTPNLVYAPEIDPQMWRRVEDVSQNSWQGLSGDANWKVSVFQRVTPRAPEL